LGVNTPRTKKPKRYSGSTPGADDKEYQRGIMNEEMRGFVGFIITYWAHIEERMVPFFADLTGIDNEPNARIVFRSIINQKARISIMRALLEKSHPARNISVGHD
jgi:hypothetical protein